MSKYWSNEDDNQVSYTSDQPVHESRPDAFYRRPAGTPSPARAEAQPAATMTPGRRLARYENGSGQPQQQPTEPAAPTPDRSSFIAEDLHTEPEKKGEMQFAPPPKFAKPMDDSQRLPDFYSFAEDGYQIRTETQSGQPGGPKKRHVWLIVLVIVAVLAGIGSAAYLYRAQLLDWVGKTFGEELVWKISPTPTPTEEPIAIPAYVEAAPLQAKPAAMAAIAEIAGGVPMETRLVTGSNIVQQVENNDGTYDYYLFTAADGRLLGYYEGISRLVLCAEDLLYIDTPPYLITKDGYPLVNLSSFRRGAGGNVTVSPMINGWALIRNSAGTTYNFLGTDGKLISDLWFCKTFPFTADSTLGYVDTGMIADTQTRYALYLLYQNGETTRLSYQSNTDEVLESVCGLAFMQNGDVYLQGEDLTYLTHTDDVAAYANCGALAVRNPDTQLYGLFVDGVQQYDFIFDSIAPMASDLQWAASENGYVRRYAVDGRTYPLPRSYSFILKKGDTRQIVSISAVSSYPIVFD